MTRFLIPRSVTVTGRVLPAHMTPVVCPSNHAYSPMPTYLQPCIPLWNTPPPGYPLLPHGHPFLPAHLPSTVTFVVLSPSFRRFFLEQCSVPWKGWFVLGVGLGLCLPTTYLEQPVPTVVAFTAVSCNTTYHVQPDHTTQTDSSDSCWNGLHVLPQTLLPRLRSVYEIVSPLRSTILYLLATIILEEEFRRSWKEGEFLLPCLC